jgi:plastocyanin
MNALKTLLRSSIFLFYVGALVSCSSPSKQNNINSKTQEKPAPSVDTINIVQMKFSPADLPMHAGDTVVWINHDMVAHDITDQKNKSWTSSLLQPGQSWKMVVTKDENYYCSIHQVMTGKIIVE